MRRFAILNLLTCGCTAFVHNAVPLGLARSTKLMSTNPPPAFTDTSFVDADNTTPLPSEVIGGEQYTVDEPRPVVSSPGMFTGKVFVAGASGFVGSQVCKELLALGAQVVGLSRQGAPVVPEHPWYSQVEWIQGSALDPASYESAMKQCDSVVSCIGGFGATDAYLGLVNGDCNVKLCETAKAAGVDRFVFISVHQYKLPRAVKSIGYFSGKRRAEAVIGQLYGEDGFVLQPAFIYGEKTVTVTNPISAETKKVTLPLRKFGEPAAKFTASTMIKRLANSGLPFADAVYTQPLSVEEVAFAAARCAAGTATAGITAGSSNSSSSGANILTVDDIKRIK